jgi:glucose-6-phosphate 1-dehydrogenase
MATRTIPVETFDLAIFGATGDLSKRKILPSLYKRMVAGQLPKDAQIIGLARSDMSREAFQKLAKSAITEFVDKAYQDKKTLASFLECLHYFVVDVNGDAGWEEFRSVLRDNAVRAFYLSVGPSLFGQIASQLDAKGIATETSRIVVEKPLGHDLDSAVDLNNQLAGCFSEHQIYRIDHYLGKETVQNLMAIRFANALFEPLWNSHQIDHVQITVAETLSVAGRGAYYDRSGAMRDMVQNHLMQLLCLTAMEPPAKFDPNAVRDEKLKVIRALQPVGPEDIVRGQYRAGLGEDSYVEHAENPESRTESFIAMKVQIANWRWAGVPFYLRTGKRLRTRLSEISVIFKKPPHHIFGEMEENHRNTLVIRLQPDEGITLHMTIKEPGPGGMRLTEVPLDMSFAEALGEEAGMPDAYERLIMDVVRGNQTLFMRGDEVEAAWAWVDPIIAGWSDGPKPKPYDAGSSGPDDALMLLHKDGRRWRDLEV